MPDLTQWILFLIPIAWQMMATRSQEMMTSRCKVLLSRFDVAELKRRSKNDLGPGLAMGFYSWLENALVDSSRQKQMEDFIEKENIQNNVGSRTLLILFPDFSSSYYSQYLERNTRNDEPVDIGLVSGMVDIEHDDIAVGADPSSTSGKIEYRYEEKSGRLRKCNYTVFQIEEESDYDRTQKEQMYYFACDNRPLLSLQKWYQDEDLHGKGVSKEELFRHFNSYKENLVHLLDSNPKLRMKYKVLEFRGPLSKGVKAWRETFRYTPSAPPGSPDSDRYAPTAPPETQSMLNQEGATVL